MEEKFHLIDVPGSEDDISESSPVRVGNGDTSSAAHELCCITGQVATELTLLGELPRRSSRYVGLRVGV